MNFRFSGHETFPCRYAWLPKAYRAIQEDCLLFADEDRAMVKLGVGKNMARSIRFWMQVADIGKIGSDRRCLATPFGHALLAPNGLDPFLEDVQTLWLLHWKLSTPAEDPMFAWHFLLNHWHHPELTRTEVMRSFEAEARRQDRKLSHVTLEQHFDTFLHTYVPTRSRKGDVQEDNLDCPLVELRLLETVGERSTGDGGKRETVYAFRREPKPEISGSLFAFCLHDFWTKRHPNENTLSFREISVGEGSLGAVFKLSEADLRERLDRLQGDSDGAFFYEETAAFQRVTRLQPPMNQPIEDEPGREEGHLNPNFLRAIYQPEARQYLN